MYGRGLGQKVLFSTGWNLIVCVPDSIQGWGTQGGSRLHLFVSDVDPGNEDFKCKNVCAKIFLRVPQGWKGSP